MDLDGISSAGPREMTFDQPKDPGRRYWRTGSPYPREIHELFHKNVVRWWVSSCWLSFESLFSGGGDRVCILFLFQESYERIAVILRETVIT